MKSIIPGSPASGTTIKPGDILRKINGAVISDVLDYMYYSCDSRLLIELTGAGGIMKLVRLHKPEGADIGLEFGSFLMDRERSCANKCIFCFIDQLPAGMRETMYYKDDDVRLSLLQGNYVTLTNLSQQDLDRIARLRISPVNVSVHTLDPGLRAYMLGIKDGAGGIKALKALVNAGITLNCQIVCCPEVNDGPELMKTMRGLYTLGSGINSVSVVPVGLTKHRQGLTPLQPFDRARALATVRQVRSFGNMCRRERGSTVFFCADEMYIKAGLTLPPDSYYEDYPQLENGVGMMRLLITEFEEALAGDGDRESGSKALSAVFEGQKPGDTGTQIHEPFSVATGTAASKHLTKLLKIATQMYDKISGAVYAVENRFFGDSVTVSGLVTGGDIIDQLRGCDLGSRLLIPQNMLRHGEDVFLDDVTVPELSGKLGVPVRVVKQNGADLLRAFQGRD